MARLILKAGKPDEAVFELHEGANTIGRTKDNEVFLLHKSLSRQHARIVIAGTEARSPWVSRPRSRRQG